MSESPRPLIVRLAANASALTAGNVLASVISVVTFAAVTRYLGPSSFGDLTAALAFLFIPTVLADLGFSAVVLREISAAPATTSKVMSAAIPFRLAVAAAASLIAVGIALALPFNDQTDTAIAIGSIGMFLTLANYGLLPALQAGLQMHRAVTATLAGRIATLIVTLLAVEADLGFAAIVWAVVLGAAVTFGINLVVVRRVVHLRFVIDLPAWARLARASVALGLAVGLAQVYFRVDAVLLSLLGPSADVGLYGAAYRFLELAQMLAGAITISVFPSLALDAAADRERALRLAQKTFELLAAVGLGLLVLMLVVPRELITLFAGEEFAAGADAVRIMAPVPLFMLTASLFWWLLVSRHQDRLLAALAVGLLALNVGLNLALIPAYGYKAAAAVTTATEACALFLIVTLAIKRVDFVPSLWYARALVPAAGAMVLIAVLMPGPGLLAAAIGGIAYWAILLATPGTIRSAAVSIVRGGGVAGG